MKLTKFHVIVVSLVGAVLIATQFGQAADAEPGKRKSARRAAVPALPPVAVGLGGAGGGDVLGPSKRVLIAAAMQTAEDRRKLIETLREKGDLGLAELRRSMHQPLTQDVAAYCLAKLGNDADRRNVAQLFKKKAASPLSPALALAAAALEDRQTLDELVSRHDSRDPLLREAVAIALCKSPEPDVKVLLHLIMDRNEQVREAAESTLVRLKDRLAIVEVRWIADELMETGSLTLRRAVMRLCSEVEAPWVADVVMAATRDKSAVVRTAALRVLGQLGDAQTIVAVMAALQQGTDRQTRVAGALALAGFRLDAELRSEIRWIAGQQDDPVVVMAIGHTLLARGDANAIPLLIQLLGAAKIEVKADRVRFVETHVHAMLEACATGSPRREGEDWAMWWARVQQRFELPRQLNTPEFSPRLHTRARKDLLPEGH